MGERKEGSHVRGVKSCMGVGFVKFDWVRRGRTWGGVGRPPRGPHAHCAVIGPPVVSTTPPHPEASPDRPGAVTVSRIVARNSGHPEPYTGTRTVLVCSSTVKERPSSTTGAGWGEISSSDDSDSDPEP